MNHLLCSLILILKGDFLKCGSFHFLFGKSRITRCIAAIISSEQRACIGVEYLPLFEKEARRRQAEAGGDKKSIEYKESVSQLIDEAIKETENENHRIPQMKKTKTDPLQKLPKNSGLIDSM